MQRKHLCGKRNSHKRMMRMVSVIAGLLLVAMLATACNGDVNPSTAANSGGTEGSTQGTTEGSTEKGAEGTTSSAGPRTYDRRPVEGVTPSKQTVQTFGAEGSGLEETIRAHMKFAKAEPREDNLVFTVDLSDSGFETYKDVLGREVRPMEQFFFPFLNDDSAEAVQFNDGIAERIEAYREALVYHEAEATGVLLGYTYKTFLYDGYLSIVMLEWLEDGGVGYVNPHAVVYDLVRRKFLSKHRIVEDLGFDLAGMTASVDSWYAEGDRRVLDGYDHRRDMGTALLEIWTDAYDLFEGTTWKADYERRHELARTYYYALNEPMEFYAPYFIDDEGRFCMIKTTLVSGAADEHGLLPGSYYIPSYTNAFEQALRSDGHDLPTIGFSQLAKLTETDGQDIDAYLIRLGKNIEETDAMQRLEALNSIDGLSALGLSLLQGWRDGGVLDLYVVVPKYANTVIGVQRVELNDATEWQSYGHTVGYAMAVLDERESEIHIVHRNRYGTLKCEDGRFEVTREGAKVFDATEWLVPKSEVSPEVKEIIRFLAPKG